MKYLLLVVKLCILFSAYSQETPTIAVSPIVDLEIPINQKIVNTVDSFLRFRDDYTNINRYKYCERSDFDRFGSPFFFLQDMEKNNSGKHVFDPCIMEIIPWISQKQFIVKISFISSSKPLLKALVNVIAKYDNDTVKISSYLNFTEQTWQRIEKEEMTYYISRNRLKNINKDIKEQIKFNKIISKYFDIPRISLTYYSASTVEEFFNMQGFQYHPMMFADSTGGVVYKDNILSANNSEYYPHEISHLYIRKAVPGINQFFDEGLATYLGGSGTLSYEQLKAIFKKEVSNIDIWKVCQSSIFDKSYWKHDFPASYVIASVVCEYGIKKYGKSEFLKLLQNERETKLVFEKLGLNNENIQEQLLRL
ncbi:hypothetical protein [Sphingobacterium multivorum]|uniref:hypothetical protein n=2 Tax=Sphingobacterium multivorum TaxID=28454 RepID=UPI0028B2596E|nr:hypothetical protein [Sphingobacterium multivorum]